MGRAPTSLVLVRVKRMRTPGAAQGRLFPDLGGEDVRSPSSCRTAPA